jgi:chemotaxis protein CheX
MSTLVTSVPNDSSKQSVHPFVGTFASCTKKIFSTMLGWDIVLADQTQSRGFLSKYDVSGLIGFSGSLRGTLVVSCDAEMTYAAAEAFLGARPADINEDVVDLVGELTNMIGGSSKDRLGIAGIELGLPAVVSGIGHRVSFQPSAHVEIMHFMCDAGPFTVEIGFRIPNGQK